MAWISLVYVLFMLDSTSGIRCQSCTGTTITNCHHVVTCAQNEICYVGCGAGCILSCMPKSNCPSTPHSSSGLGGSFFAACCDDGDSCVLHLPQLFPPKVTHLGPPKITGSTLVELHSTTKLSCSDYESVVVNYSWLFNGGSTLPPHALHVTHNSLLEIRDVTRSEVGTYTCIIAKDGVTANASVVVSVVEANSPIGVVTLDIQRPLTNGKLVLVHYDSTLISCRSQRNDVTFAWQFNGSSTLPRSVTPMGAYLRIDEMDGAKEGSYTCIVSKNGLATSASVWVSVKEDKAGVFQLAASPTNPLANHPLDVICRVKGFPEPTIIWSFRDPMGQNYLPPGSSNLTPNKIHIDHFQPSLHSGTWTCMARNSLGVDQRSIQI